MRLSGFEIDAIKATALSVFGAGATVRLFGSRVDDRRRGGDIDLFVEVDAGQATFANETRFVLALEDAIGEQRIDVLLHERGSPLRPIERIAMREGMVL